MLRVRLDNPPWDYIAHARDHRWDQNWIERPRLWGSAVALALSGAKTVGDPACGDGAVVAVAHAITGFEKVYLNDISRFTVETLAAPVEAERSWVDASEAIRNWPHLDAIVLTEILEHLENPDALLRLAHEKADWLVASSPIVPDGKDHTTQHLWAFDEEGYREMLVDAGWTPKVWYTVGCENHPYKSGFQIWGCQA